MIRKERKKGPVWKHFNVESKNYNSHPPVQCKYCFKNYQRVVPERMQAHLDKCLKAPNSAKSQSKQQSIFDNFSDSMSGENQNSNVLSSTEVNLSQPIQSSFKLQNNKEINMQIDYNSQSDSLSNIHHLGHCYQHGIGIEKNEIRAFQLYKEAAEKGHIVSKYYLGKCYQHGIGIEINDIKSFELYKELVQNGHINSIYDLGECYRYGIGTEKDETKTFESYKKAAQKGHIISKYKLGECYDCGIGTETNKIKAFESYKEAAQNYHLGSMYQLGYCYQFGIGTEKMKLKHLNHIKKQLKKVILIQYSILDIVINME